MARPIHIATAAGVALAVAGVAYLVFQVGRDQNRQEQLMANFEDLDTDIAELRQGVADTAARVEDALERLLDDTADQAQVEEAREEIRGALAELKAIAPAEPAPEPEPVEPTA